MKKKYFIYLIILTLLFLVSCGEKRVYVCADGSEVSDSSLCQNAASEISTSSDDNDVSEEEIVEETEEEVEEIEEITDSSQVSSTTTDYALSDSEKSLLEERLGPAERAELSQPFIKNMHIGDTYIVALGIQNILGTNVHDFVVDIKFREAKDFSNSVLPTDDELIQDWLGKNIFTSYTLERGEKTIIPIIIEVGDRLDNEGNPVVPGTYLYDVYIGYITSQGNTDDYQNLILTLQVVE